MAWVDDRIWCHPKFVGLSPKAFRIWVHATAYSSGFSTKGRLTIAQQATVGCTSKIKLELVVAGLWHHADDGAVEINDWDDHNGQRDRAKDLARERMKRSRATAPQPNREQWNEARERVYGRDGGICFDCGKDCNAPEDGRDIWNADHEPSREALIARGDSIYDLRFIVTRCHSCHAKKTRKEANAKRTTDRTTERTLAGAPDEGVKSEENTRAVGLEVDAQPSDGDIAQPSDGDIAQIIELSLKGAA